MKIMTDEELRLRLRRTVTNKFSTTINPHFRRELRETAFSDREFCYAVSNAVKRLETISKAIEEKRNENNKASS